MKTIAGGIVFVFLTAFSALTMAAIPSAWNPRGVGGGGSLYSPSINPVDDNEYYVACDMGELFHTADWGATYAIVPFYRIQGANNARVCFTSNPFIRYCISYANDIVVPVKSIDGGATWAVLAGNPDASEETYGIFADYNHPGRIAISYYGSIFISADSGATFSDIHDAVNSGAGVVVGGAFFTGDTIVFGTNDGLIVSTDGGAHFNVVAVAGIVSGQTIFSFAGAKQGSSMRFFCLTANTADVYVGVPGSDYYGFMQGVYSLDWPGGTWVSRMNGITVGSDYPMYVAMASNNVNVAYLGGSTGEPLVLKTADGGTSWSHVFNTANNQNIATGWSGAGGDRGWGYGECVFGLGVAPFNADKVVISDMGFVHTTSDGGTTWQQAYLSAADQHPAGSTTPTRQYYHSIGLENTSCWQVFWYDSTHLFAPFTDISGVRSIDAGVTWSFDYTGYTANTMYRIIKNNSGMLYAGTSGIHDMYQSTRLADNPLNHADPNGNIIYSTNQGATWQVLHAFNHPVFWVALDPNDQNTMYASVVDSVLNGGVWVSHNLQNGATSTWTLLPAPPRTEGHPACIVVLNDSSVVCTYSGRRTTGFTASSGTFIYTPRANAWADVSDPGMYYWTKDIIVDPFDASQNTWYVCVFSGWGGAPNGLGGIYKTINRGQSWARINDLDRVTSVTINQNDGTEAYITTESEGLWHSSNFNAATPTFSRIDSYPFQHPERVFFNPYKTTEIWIASFGNGMRVGSTVPQSVIIKQKLLPAAHRIIARYIGGKIEVDIGRTTDGRGRFAVASINGRIVYRANVTGRELKSGRVSFNVGPLPAGLYLVSMGAERTIMAVTGR
jgi:photosystem II stability/assembly factor-like uncharacterized protein